MSTFSKWIALALLGALATAAWADGITNPITGNRLGFDGVNNPTASSGPPPTCDGTIDLSKGCTQPMLGVM